MTDPAAPSRPPRRQVALRGQVLRQGWLSPHLVRVVVGGPGLDAFTPAAHADSYVKLAFAAPGPRPLTDDGRVDLTALREDLGPDAVRLRAYTVRRFDAGGGPTGGEDGGRSGGAELTLDLVVHGDEGLAGPWAAAARGGEEVLVVGPGGAWSPDPHAHAHLLVGDASALPAVAVALERLHPAAQGHAVLEVAGVEDHLDLDAPDGVEVTWVHTRAGAPGAALVDAVRAIGPSVPAHPGAVVDAFLHGEAGMVRELRRHLRGDLAVARERLSASGYWRLGVDDEGWRASKRAWAGDVEGDEAAVAAPTG